MIDIGDMIHFAELWSRLPTAVQDQCTNIFLRFPDKAISSLLNNKILVEETLTPIQEFLEKLVELYPTSLVSENATEVLSEIYGLEEE